MTRLFLAFALILTLVLPPALRPILHASRIPLADVDLRSETDRGQLSLWDAECDGVCGV